MLRSYVFGQDSQHIGSLLWLSGGIEMAFVEASFIFTSLSRIDFIGKILESVFWTCLLETIWRIYRGLLLVKHVRGVVIQICQIERISSRRTIIVNREDIELSTSLLKVSNFQRTNPFSVILTTGRDFGIDGSKTFCPSFGQFGNRGCLFFSDFQVIIHGCLLLFELNYLLSKAVMGCRFLICLNFDLFRFFLH